ncbi:YicC family protein [Alcaligenaceae bacterium]|nr:YicC family protein [Alcaligenaceae bacterium]
MIRSMTAFGSARTESEHGSLSIEFRTVNSRFLDVNFRLPDDLRMVEGLVREQLGRAVSRGKVDIRLNYTRAINSTTKTVDQTLLAYTVQQLQEARRLIPDLAAPRLSDVLSDGAGSTEFDVEVWTAMCQQASAQALEQLQAARLREGQRLAAMMLECSHAMAEIVDLVEADLPALLAAHQEKINTRLHDALLAVSPEGFAQIGGQELSARIAQEASLFSLRIDVAEELSRLRSHMAELNHLLSEGENNDPAAGGKSRKGSTGKRLDFLFQEMNREANTLGSKAGNLDMTRAAIDLKLLIEQMREQAQNIE